MKMTFRRGRMASLGMVLAIVVTSCVVGGAATVQAAADRADFNPELIIEDSQFYDSRAMSKSQIAEFFQQKIGTCDNGLCMNVVRTSTESRAPDSVCKGYVGAPSESVADIIFKTQESCGISAKVLLVLLQKEQSLVTAKSPSLSRLDRAMGYGCPDDPNRQGWCDPSYGGLYNQIFRSAWQFKRYSNPPGSGSPFTRYPVGRPTQVQFHPNLGCGSSSLTIRNAATAALYYYTPYQPNESALANLYGTGDACATYGNRNFWRMYTDWFGNPAHGSYSPVGAWDGTISTVDSFRLTGWAYDPDSAGAVPIHAYIDGRWGGAFNADVVRSDLTSLPPGAGSRRGFDIIANYPNSNKSFDVCLYAYNFNQGQNTALGCKSVTRPSGPPFGNLEYLANQGGTVVASGWAIARSSKNPITIEILVNGTVQTTVAADIPRQDVATHHPGYGAAHGFSISIPTPVGVSNVCVKAVGPTEDGTTMLGCSAVSGAGGPPIGSFEYLGLEAPGIAAVAGWSIDPDTVAPIDIHAYVNGRWGGAITANKPRSDVGRIHSSYGDQHGFHDRLRVQSGVNEVCLFAFNVGAGHNALLGCSTVISPSGTPFGNFEGAWPVTGGVAIGGWVIDPDTTDSIDIHAYVDGRWGGSFAASAMRPDVAAVHRMYGPNHGFSQVIPLDQGRHSVCLFGYNVGGGQNLHLGCREVG